MKKLLFFFLITVFIIIAIPNNLALLNLDTFAQSPNPINVIIDFSKQGSYISPFLFGANLNHGDLLEVGSIYEPNNPEEWKWLPGVNYRLCRINLFHEYKYKYDQSVAANLLRADQEAKEACENFFVAKIREAGITTLRFPYAETYDWKGEFDELDCYQPSDPKKANCDTALPGVENYCLPHNGMWGPSIGEFLELTKKAGAEPFIAVNLRGEFNHKPTGANWCPYNEVAHDAQDGADLVEYLNTPLGENPSSGLPEDEGIAWAEVRAGNEQYCLARKLNPRLCLNYPEPFNVVYFEIGNEPNQMHETPYGGNGVINENMLRQFANAHAKGIKKIIQVMKRINPNIKTVVMGYSITYPQLVLRHNKPEIWQEELAKEGVLEIIDGVQDHYYNFTPVGAGETLVFNQVNLPALVQKLKTLYPNKFVAITEWSLNLNNKALGTLEHTLYTAEFLAQATLRGVNIAHFHPLSFPMPDDPKIEGGSAGLITKMNLNRELTNAQFWPFKYLSQFAGGGIYKLDINSPVYSYTPNYNDSESKWCTAKANNLVQSWEDNLSACAPVAENVSYVTVYALKKDSKVGLLAINADEKEYRLKVNWRDILSNQVTVITVMSGSYQDINTFDNPTKIIPQESKQSYSDKVTLPDRSVVFVLGSESATLLPGDANQDGQVDSEDFALLVEDYLKEPVHDTDFNSDGRVDSEDFAILQANYQKD